MPDDFSEYKPGLSSPAVDAFAVTPHDTNALAKTTRGLYVGGAGDVSVITSKGTTVLFTGVVACTVLPLRVTHVRSTETTATGIVGLV